MVTLSKVNDGVNMAHSSCADIPADAGGRESERIAICSGTTLLEFAGTLVRTQERRCAEVEVAAGLSTPDTPRPAGLC